jgi:hypothetical protein
MQAKSSSCGVNLGMESDLVLSNVKGCGGIVRRQSRGWRREEAAEAARTAAGLYRDKGIVTAATAAAELAERALRSGSDG